MIRTITAVAIAALMISVPLTAEAKTTSTVTIAVNETGLSLGDTVSFTVDAPKRVKNIGVNVRCYQNNVLVWGTAAFENTNYTTVLGGGSSDWVRNGGPATCTAQGFDYVWRGGQQYGESPSNIVTFEVS